VPSGRVPVCTVTSVGFAVGAGASQSLTLAPLHASHALFWGAWSRAGAPPGCSEQSISTDLCHLSEGGFFEKCKASKSSRLRRVPAERREEKWLQVRGDVAMRLVRGACGNHTNDVGGPSLGPHAHRCRPHHRGHGSTRGRRTFHRCLLSSSLPSLTRPRFDAAAGSSGQHGRAFGGLHARRRRPHHRGQGSARRRTRWQWSRAHPHDHGFATQHWHGVRDGLHVVRLLLDVDAVDQFLRSVNRNLTLLSPIVRSTYKPAHIHLWDFGRDWGVYWHNCRAGPNAGHKRAGTAKKGGEWSPVIRNAAPIRSRE